jgi:hypothetical protein
VHFVERPNRFDVEFQISLFRCSVSLFNIASYTCTNEIVPGVLASFRNWNNVIYCKMFETPTVDAPIIIMSQNQFFGWLETH